MKEIHKYNMEILDIFQDIIYEIPNHIASSIIEEEGFDGYINHIKFLSFNFYEQKLSRDYYDSLREFLDKELYA